MCIRDRHNIAVEAWSPLGGGMAASDPTIAAIAQKYGKSGPQVVLRWILQKGIIVFPRSSKQERIVQNADVFDFELAAEDCAKIDALNAWKDVYKRQGKSKPPSARSRPPRWGRCW